MNAKYALHYKRCAFVNRFPIDLTYLGGHKVSPGPKLALDQVLLAREALTLVR